MKTCSKCRAEKPISEFRRDKSRKDGVRGYCKACSNSDVRAAYWREPETYRERSRVWNTNHRERRRDISRRGSRKWREGHPELVSASWQQWYANNAEDHRENARMHYWTDPEASNARGKMRRAGVRRLVIDGYGGACACCGEATHQFLTIDHPNDDGAAHRREVGAGHRFYLWLVSQGFPDEYRLLCRNCNWGRYVNGGVCPHQTPAELDPAA